MRNAAFFIAGQSELAEAGILHSIVRAARRALKAWRDHSEVARLGDFDDHMLADIGLHRSDIRAVLDLPFAADPGRELQLRSARRRAGWNA